MAWSPLSAPAIRQVSRLASATWDGTPPSSLSDGTGPRSRWPATRCSRSLTGSSSAYRPPINGLSGARSPMMPRVAEATCGDRCHRLPYVNWSLLMCALRGHYTYAPEEPRLRARLHATMAPRQARRCLRCGSFVPGPRCRRSSAEEATPVRRENELRSALILRFFAVERFARVIVFGVIAYFLWRFKSSRRSYEQGFNRELPAVRSTLRAFGFHIDH